MTDRALRPPIAGTTTDTIGSRRADGDVAALVRSLYAGPPVSRRSAPSSASHRSVAHSSSGTTDERARIDANRVDDTIHDEPPAVPNNKPDIRDDVRRGDIPNDVDLDVRMEAHSGDSTEVFLERRLRTAEFVILPNNDLAYRTAKRLIDIVAASLLLVCSLPLFLLLVLLIRFDSPGPAIFRQTRVTRNGRHFTFFKFRTMYADARERFPEHYRFTASPGNDDVFYKLAEDPRNTRMGRWLRRSTLDELPNLLNVLKGDISLVGPRPDLPELIRFYSDLELSCLLTKAGITGSAQTRGRSLLTMKERLRFDLYYVSHQSTWLDAKLMLKTVLVVLLRRGAF
jgi:lipopolysaccharide/colanic/teichoic acid biosynthesis glycosyltransferase